MNMDMNLDCTKEKAVTEPVTRLSDFWHTQVWESASVSDPSEFIFGDQADKGNVLRWATSRANGDHGVFVRMIL
jgi:hypothetical protein